MHSLTKRRVDNSWRPADEPGIPRSYCPGITPGGLSPLDLACARSVEKSADDPEDVNLVCREKMPGFYLPWNNGSTADKVRTLEEENLENYWHDWKAFITRETLSPEIEDVFVL
ncbi:hypothetical protein KM043_005369 [Ampulex compressa]|nr:hypothetical protein KM043_005369 [Ampulex compressa]